jgi:P-type Mg2+ transporter
LNRAIIRIQGKAYMEIRSDHSTFPFWAEPIEALIAYLQSSRNGLTDAEAERRTQQFGRNLLRRRPRQTAFRQFLAKFRNPLIILLVVAGSISALTGDRPSFVIITLMVIGSVTLDFIQEYRAGNAADRLRRSVAVRVVAMRDGMPHDVMASELVPGDIVMLSAGDLVPADGRLLEARDFFINQGLLTGESYPVEKHASELPAGTTDMTNADNSVFMGSSVIGGNASVLLCRTGKETALGSISESLRDQAPPSAFEKGTRQFGLLIMRFTILLVLFVLLVNIYYHRPWLETFLFAVALSVGLTPELLPMIVTVTLARGAMRMADKKVIVKRLASIHNLGSMDVLCTDKTGTLTEAHIRLERHITGLGQESNRVLELAYLNSRFETGVKNPLDEAILAHQEIDVSAWRKIDEVPFGFERRRISVLIDNGKQRMLAVKGAPEDILRLSTRYQADDATDLRPLDEDALQRIRAQFESLGREGFRVLGIAYREVGPEHSHAIVDDETELVFAGFAAFLDPPKESAAETVRKLARYDVDIKVVTGDNELVTQYICSRLSIPIKGIITGSEIAQMDEPALHAQVEKANLFCRVTPAQKNRIILALQRRGHTVGYMGDGINDAPSLHTADVGISVDSAVDVAREAADMILLERDLDVLHEGVMEGRRTFGNIMKYIMMATSSNFGNMFSMAGGVLFLPFLPMLPTQILLNNFLYDTSEIPIPMDTVDSTYLKHPRQWNMDIIRNFMLVIGPISSLFDFLTFYIMLKVFGANEALFHTGWFIESLASQVLVIFIIRTRRSPLVSQPHPLLMATSLAVVTLAVLIPFTPLGTFIGFVHPPMTLLLVLAAMVGGYLFMAEWAKRKFYRAFATP